MEKARKFHKNIYFCFIDYTKAFNCVGHNKLKKPFFFLSQKLEFICFFVLFCFLLYNIVLVLPYINMKILKEMGIPDHLTCLLRKLYAGQEATVRIGHGKMDWFQIGKGAHQGRVLSPCLFNLYAKYITWNTWLDEAQAGIKVAGRNINILRCVDDTTLMTES